MSEYNNIAQDAGGAEPEAKLTKKDLNKAVWYSILLQGTFNYENYQGLGWCAMLAPALKKIFRNKPDELRQALHDNTAFFNTQPVVSTFLQGLTLSMYEGKEEFSTINNVRLSLFGPLAGVGDSIFWFTLLPIMVGICSSMAVGGNLLGPAIYFLVYIAVFCTRFFFIRLGYNTGAKAVSQIGEKTKDLSVAASILGNTVIGALIATYISFSVKVSIPIGEGEPLKLQEAFFDMIIPNLLPLLITLLIAFFIKKKSVSPTIIILGILVLCILLSWVGIV
jgi:PTS system galactosamine-specific IID component